MKNFSQKGFTLIELLVVISIIGVLSSVVLAALKTARDKGVVAAGLQYEGYVQRTQSDRAAVWWKFNDTTGGTTATDSSGLGNTGTFVGGGSIASNVNALNAAKGNIGYFTGASYVSAPNASNMTITTNGFTFMAWIKPANLPPGSYEELITKGSNQQLYMYNNQLLMKVQTNLGWVQMTVGTGPIISRNTWTHVSGVFDANGNVKVYVNGKLEGGVAPPGLNPTPSTDQTTPFIAGFLTGTTYNFGGYMDDVVYINEALTTAEIQKNYAETKGDYLLAAN